MMDSGLPIRTAEDAREEAAALALVRQALLDLCGVDILASDGVEVAP